MIDEVAMVRAARCIRSCFCYSSGPKGPAGGRGIYKATQLLPAVGDECQYRIKNADEAHERVVKETELERVV
jgi:hypothetical protein